MGKVIDVNTSIIDSLEGISKLQNDPYGEGWLAKIEPDNLERDLPKLITAFKYCLKTYDYRFTDFCTGSSRVII